MGNTAKAILAGTAVSGTLDILSAFIFGGMAGASPVRILTYVASGPFGTLQQGPAAAALGLATHYLLMAFMVTMFVIAARRVPMLTARPVLWGALYGIGIYLVMYWLVVPARFGRFPALTAWGVGNSLFSHILCVGIPMALVTRQFVARALRK